MNHPLASEMSAIGTRQVPVAAGNGDGDGDASAGEGDTDSDGDGDGLRAGDGVGPAGAVGLAPAMNPASRGTAPQAARITQQTAAKAARFACISVMTNAGVATWVSRLCSFVQQCKPVAAGNFRVSSRFHRGDLCIEGPQVVVR